MKRGREDDDDPSSTKVVVEMAMAEEKAKFKAKEDGKKTVLPTKVKDKKGVKFEVEGEELGEEDQGPIKEVGAHGGAVALLSSFPRAPRFFAVRSNRPNWWARDSWWDFLIPSSF